MTEFWNSLPAPLRSVLNVVVGAAFAAAVTWGVGVVNGAPVDFNALVTAVLTAAGVVLTRALNPGDPVYGVGSDGGE